MFLSLGALSLGANTNTVVIPRMTYDKVTFLGESTIDGAHIRNIELSDSAITSITTEETLGVNSIFLANFEGTLQAGNYNSLIKPIVSWKIKRRKTTDFSPINLVSLDKSITSYTDFGNVNHQDYEYQLSPISSDGTEGIPIMTTIQSNFYGWFLVSIDNTKVYKFDMELSSESIILNTDRKVFENYSQFPVVRTGAKKYHSGGLKTMPYKYNDTNIDINYAYMKEIEDFISDGETKILKNTKGDLFYVQTSDFQYQYRDVISEQPMDISFKFIEVAGV